MKCEYTSEDDSTEPLVSISSFSHCVSYVSPKVYLKYLDYGMGMFAGDEIQKDEIIICWSGRIVHHTDLVLLDDYEKRYALQIDEELFQVPIWPGNTEPADFTNHSCNPNCGFGGSPITLVAMRTIEPGEEITFDYAMSDSNNFLFGDWECLCGSHNCRGKITCDDWKNPELWQRYGQYFTPYLKKKIDRLMSQNILNNEYYL